jgi:lipoprotein-anchoring transpeptidase ErfK/SrfK
MIMRRVSLTLLTMCLATPVFAQAHTYPEWAAKSFGRSSGGGGVGVPPSSWWSDDEDEKEARRPFGEKVRDGGGRPDVSPQAPPIVDFNHGYAPNSIVIDAGARRLYYVLAGNRAYAYSIGVGREGFGWSGTEKVTRKQAWPDWHPPKEMRERDPSLPEKMTGGVRNPLGAVAMYLGNTLYRIHGTNDARSIGRAQSSGCFRMMNASAMHLSQLTQIGTTVTVVKSLPRGPRISRSPQPETQPVLVKTEQAAPSTDDASAASPERASEAAPASTVR